MAVEAIRGCGYRKVGGMYLVGGILNAPCDRLPIPLECCPVCGQGIKVGRGVTKINPHKLWGSHSDCKDAIRPCLVCDAPNKVAYIMGVGERYYKTPQDFINEGEALGVCKRIAAIPKDLRIDKTVVYLAHPKACIKNGSGRTKKGQGKMLEYQLGVFCAFIPHKIEQLVWDKDLKGKRGRALKKQLRKRRITPVPVPFGDKDHK